MIKLNIEKLDELKQRLTEIHDGIDFSVMYCVGYVHALGWENQLSDDEVDEMEKWIYEHIKK